jgi:hypothetical protein
MIDLHWILQSEPDKEFALGLTSPIHTIVAQPTQMRIVIADVPVPEVNFAISAVLRWQSVAGANYRVIWTNDLGVGTWMNLQDKITGTGGEIVVSDPITAPRRSYRIELDP